MVLPSLKSIKTLFGSPHRRSSGHNSRRHKEKKLTRNADVGEKATDDRSIKVLNQVHPTPDSEPEMVNGLTMNNIKEVDAIETRLKTSSVIGQQHTNAVKDSPAKALVAPFNSASDDSKLSFDNDALNHMDKNTITDQLIAAKDSQILIMEKLTEDDFNRKLLNIDTELRPSTETLTLQLNEERALRREAEQRLQTVSFENEFSKQRLLKLQQDFGRLEEMLYGLLQYKTRIDWLQKEKATQSLTYEMKLCKYQKYVDDLEKENSMLLGEVKSLESTSKQFDEREHGLSRVLLERLRYLEAENSSLVLETEQQRLQYERCLDDVANQVVQALLTQKSLRDECIKLQKRVSDLEQHNRNLSLMFKRHIQHASDSHCHKGKTFSRPGTCNSSNQSSMATQTTSQSEDSLESLASLCSEYSAQSGFSGNGNQGGANMMIGIPGLPQLSSPPLWIRKCLEPNAWAGLGHSTTKSNGLPSDDHIWPGMCSWDIDELLTSEEDSIAGISSTIQRRPPLLMGVQQNNQTASQYKNLLELASPPSSVSPVGVGNQLSTSSGISSLQNANTLSDQKGICVTTSQNGLINRSTNSFSFSSLQMCAPMCQSSLPRQFKFSLRKPENLIPASNDLKELVQKPESGNELDKSQDDGHRSDGEGNSTLLSTEGTTKDEGYSTMSSSNAQIVSVKAELSENDLKEEEEDLVAEIFANSLQQSLILVSKPCEDLAEEETKPEDEGSSENIEIRSLFLCTSNKLNIIEDDDCDEFYLPLKCRLIHEGDNWENCTESMRSKSDSELYYSSLALSAHFPSPASENALDLHKMKKLQTTGVLQRSKGKICLAEEESSKDEKSECGSKQKLAESNNEYSMDEVIAAAKFCDNWNDIGQEEEEEEGFEGGGTSRASWGSSVPDNNFLSNLENPQGEEKPRIVDINFCRDFYHLCQMDYNSLEKDRGKERVREDKVEDQDEEEEAKAELVDDSSEEEQQQADNETEENVGELQKTVSVREKLQELSSLIEDSRVDEEEEAEYAADEEPVGKEGCTTSWIHVEADMDLTDPNARANFLDTMVGSSSSSSECGDDLPEDPDETTDYRHLHQLHRHRRHRKATERDNCIMRYIPPPRPSIIGRRDFFFRYGEQEQAAVASFDFLEDMSTSISDFGSAETLNAEQQLQIEAEEVEEESFAVSNNSCPVGYDDWKTTKDYHQSCQNSLECPEERQVADRLSLSDSCAESFSSSNQSLDMLED